MSARKELAATGNFALNGFRTTMNWGTPPWTIDFAPEPRPLPAQADCVVVGGGFSGLAAAAWLRHISPERSVVLLEAAGIGAGASGRTGGLALAETAAGVLDGGGDILSTYLDTLARLGANGDLELPGVYEIGREGGRRDSPIVWEDSGTLRVINEVPGGTVDPGKILSGLGRAAERLGAILLENTRVEAIEYCTPVLVHTTAGSVRAEKVLLATNAQSANLSDVSELSRAKFTLAVLTEPLADHDLFALGLSAGKGFYTADLPYLWGRPMPDGAVMFGSGLVDVADDADLAALDIDRGVAAGLFASLEQRVRGLHSALAAAKFARRWGGPIRFGSTWQLFFDRHPHSRDVIVLNGLGGDGVSYSIYLGRWAAEVFAGRRDLPPWGKIPASS
jgi:glycine/D-amino acid oxidase-like deaminating enzyme